MIRIGSLFSGYGGLDMAVRSVLGGQVAWHCEHEPPTEKNPRPSNAAERLLSHHHPDIPNLGDITAVDWSTVASVDVIAGGSPCQDMSNAGQRAGLMPHTRSGLWSYMADAIACLRPNLVVWENVRGALSAEAHSDVEPCPWCVGDPGDGEPPLRALGAVLADLAGLGYDAAWYGLRAADVGAPHGRFRIFVVAAPSDSPGIRWGGREQPAVPGATHGRRGDEDRQAGRRGAPTDANGGGLGSDVVHLPARQPDPLGRPDGNPTLGGIPYLKVGGTQQRLQPVIGAVPGDRQGGVAAGVHDLGGTPAVVAWGPYADAIHRWERVLGRPAPTPHEPGRDGKPRLSARFVEWLMGLPEGWVCDVPGISRNDMLKMLGNGVVPLQAEAGIRACLAMLASAGEDPAAVAS